MDFGIITSFPLKPSGSFFFFFFSSSSCFASSSSDTITSLRIITGVSCFIFFSNNIPICIYGEISVLSNAVGKQNKAVFGIKNQSFADEMKKLINGGSLHPIQVLCGIFFILKHLLKIILVLPLAYLQ